MSDQVLVMRTDRSALAVIRTARSILSPIDMRNIALSLLIDPPSVLDIVRTGFLPQDG